MNKEAIDLIFHYSKHYANILYECESLYEEGRGFVLALCFFNIVESIIRSVNENFNNSFEESINSLSFLITEEEINILHRFRSLRNEYTHKDLNQYFIEYDGLAYSLNEDNTALKLYELYSEKIYNILIKIVRSKLI